MHNVVRLSNGEVLAWGDNSFQQSYVPSLPVVTPALRYRAIASGVYHNVALLSDGTLQAWGWDAYGQSTIPASLVGFQFKKVAAGWVHSLALRVDGQLFAWGSNVGGRCNVPPMPNGVTYVAISAGDAHSVAVRSDGQAVSFGLNIFGEGTIPPPPPGITYIDVDVFYGKTLLLRSDGQITYVGQQFNGLPLVPPLPAGVRYVKMAATEFRCGALRSDGEVVMWGSVSPTQPWWRPVPTLPPGVTWVDIDGGRGHFLLRRSDGGLEVCAQVYDQHLLQAPDPGSMYVEISANAESCLGRIGPPSSYFGIAPGCAGSQPASRLIPHDTPRIGHALHVTVSQLPANAAVIVMGWQQTAPVSLVFAGMPGCDAHVTIDGVMGVYGQQGFATWQLPIPDAPTLIGATFYNQALVLDPQAGNGFGAVASEAAKAVVGDA